TRTPTPISIGNFVWNDHDEDGFQDSGSFGLPDITVQLWNGAKTALIDQTTTNASGLYQLTAPSPGAYRVRVLLPQPGLDRFSPKDERADDLTDSDINPSGPDIGFTDIFTLTVNVLSNR